MKCKKWNYLECLMSVQYSDVIILQHIRIYKKKQPSYFDCKIT